MEDVCLSQQNCAQLSNSNCELNRKETFIVNESTSHDITPAKNINKNNQSNESLNNSEKQPLGGAEDVLAGSQISSGNFDDEFCENLDEADEEDNDLDCEINTIETTNNFITTVNENNDKSDFKDDTFFEDTCEKTDNICSEETANSRSTNANYLARTLKKRSIRCLNKMQIMEDVREGCDANPPSSPGHAEQRHGGAQHEVPLKTEDVTENGHEEDDKKEDIDAKVASIKEEQDDKKSDEEMEDKHEENSSNHSSVSEHNNKRKLENEHSPIKRLKTEIEENFIARDKIMNEFIEVAECNNLEQIQLFSDQILAEIKALNELAKEKEREWNNLLHMKKLKEELLIRLQRKRQVLIVNDTDLNEFQPETNGQQSLLKCSQKVNMLRELRAANLEKLKQRTNLLNTAYKQKPMLDVQSIIADYRQRHPETVPRRGRRIRHSQSDGKSSILGFSGGNFTIEQKSGSDNSESGSLLNSMNGNQDSTSFYRPGDDIKSYKDILLQFAKLSQAEKSELQMQLQNSSKPPPPYPEVTVHPVTSTSSVAPTNSLLHGILTKAPVKQNNASGNSAAVNGGKSSFSPTLARLLTAPEKAAGNHITSTPTMLGGSVLNPGNMSISEIFSGSKVRNEITITPVGSQYETSTKRESVEEESEDQADRLVIDEALDNPNSRNKEDNRSEDGEDVPQCQGCNQKAAQFVCAGCGNQWYCSRDCQVAAWDDHSEVCSG